MSASSASGDPSLEEALDTVLRGANEQQTAGINDSLREALNAIGRLPDRRLALARIAARIPDVSAPRGAGVLSVWLGGAVENGLDPEPAIPFLFETLLQWSRTIDLPDDNAPPTAPDDTAEEGSERRGAAPDENTLAGLEWIGQGLVAHLARSVGSRAEYEKRPEVLEELARTARVAVGCLWVQEVLLRCSGRLVVLHVAARRGLRVEYENLSNNFHLFTLLQGELEGRMPGAKRVDRETLAVARGERDGAADDSAWWHYGVPTVPEANIVASIWGEMSPADLPKIDGEQVMLLWPPQVGRSWDGGFFSPRIEAAPPRVHVREELTAEEVETWFERLKLPRLAEKPWWKFW